VPGRVTVVGLGPAGITEMTVGAVAAVRGATRLLLRTSRHPAAATLAAEGVAFDTCDDLYDAAADLGSAYAAIVDRVLDLAASDGDVTYAVPGSPHVAEATVRLLCERAGPAAVDVEFVEGMSFLEPVLAAVGADPAVDGVAVCDGRDLAAQIERWFPPQPHAEGAELPNLLVCQVDRAGVLSDVKLALLDVVAPEHEVVLVLGAASPDAEVHRSPLAQLDWGQVDPGPLATLWVPATRAARAQRRALPYEVGAGHRDAGRAFAELVALIDRLRSPGGCPWDAEQTHASLARHLLEEAYEVVDVLGRFAADVPPARGDDRAYADLEEELGDLLMQPVLHARLAQESAAFDVTAVVEGIVDKLVARHPHVFGDVEVAGGDEVVANWEVIKRDEKARASAMDDVPHALPALARAAKLIRRSSASGVVWDGAAPGAGAHDDIGTALLALCVQARALGVDAEESLRVVLALFEAAFRRAEDGGLLAGADAWSLIASGQRT